MKSKIILGIIFCFLFFVASFASAEEGLLKISALTGKVLVKAYPSQNWTDAKIGQSLQKNDIIKTENDSKVLLEFPDKSNVTLKPLSELSVEELIWNDKANKVNLNLSMGQARVILNKIGATSDFKIKTPSAICGARGTIYYIMVTETETRVFVEDGAVDFGTSDGENVYMVVQNMESIATIAGELSEPRELFGEEKDKILEGWDVGLVPEPYTELGKKKEPGDITPPEVTKEDPASKI